MFIITNHSSKTAARKPYGRRESARVRTVGPFATRTAATRGAASTYHSPGPRAPSAANSGEPIAGVPVGHPPPPDSPPLGTSRKWIDVHQPIVPASSEGVIVIS